MYDTFIGIDVGKTGSFTVITPDDKKVIYPTLCNPDYDIWRMHMLLKEHAKTTSFAVIERAQAMPGQGVVSMFEFGKGYGIWLSLLAVNYIAHQIVHAATWTKVMLAGAPGIGKERSYNAARRIFPNWDPKTKKERLYADSVLLAEYARRIQGRVDG